MMGSMGTDRRALEIEAALLGAGRPHEVAEVRSFPASARTFFVTGAVAVDVGWTAKLT
jgi:hypothetical protein